MHIPNKDIENERELRAFKQFNKDGKFKNILITFDTNEKLDNIDVLSFDEFSILF